VTAIAAGILDGLGAGRMQNLFDGRGLQKSRVSASGSARVAKRSWLKRLGESGATSFSILSRNHRLRRGVLAGEKLAAILKSTQMVIEGVDTGEVRIPARQKKTKIQMPIVARRPRRSLRQKKRPHRRRSTDAQTIVKRQTRNKTFLKVQTAARRIRSAAYAARRLQLFSKQG